MAIEILEIEGRAGYPAVGDWASSGHAAIAEEICSSFEIRLTNREGEMVGRELTVVLLKHDHSGGTPGSKEQPLSPIVPKADR
jgi:hypothetical protein